MRTRGDILQGPESIADIVAELRLRRRLNQTHSDGLLRCLLKLQGVLQVGQFRALGIVKNGQSLISQGRCRRGLLSKAINLDLKPPEGQRIGVARVQHVINQLLFRRDLLVDGLVGGLPGTL